MSERVNPVVEIAPDLDQSVSDLLLPCLDQSTVGCVFLNALEAICFDSLVVLHIMFVLLVDVDQAFLVHHAEKAAPRVLLL